MTTSTFTSMALRVATLLTLVGIAASCSAETADLTSTSNSDVSTIEDESVADDLDDEPATVASTTTTTPPTSTSTVDDPTTTEPPPTTSEPAATTIAPTTTTASTAPPTTTTTAQPTTTTTTEAAPSTTQVATTTTTTAAPATTTTTTTTAPQANGAAIYAANCSGCHGASGEGGRGPNLQSYADNGAGIAQVSNGGGGMPSFNGSLSSTEIEAVVSFVINGL